MCLVVYFAFFIGGSPFLSDELGNEDEHVEHDLINVDLDTSIGVSGIFVDLVSNSDYFILSVSCPIKVTTN